jgi:hypothetical protein
VPQIGDVITMQVVDASGLEPGPAGANITWDFSTLTNTNLMQANVVDPSTTPYGKDFPEADRCFNSNNQAFSYAKVETDAFYNIGTAVDTGGIEIIIPFTDYQKTMEYPFTYNSSYTDTDYAEFISFGVTIKQYGTVTTTGDAYGTLITPEGTFTNVLRVKQERTNIDSTFMGTMFLTATTTEFLDFSWYAENSRAPLFNHNSSGPDKMAYYTIGSTGTDEELISIEDLQIFPNPATDQVNVSMNVLQSANIEVNIHNQAGQQVMVNDALNFHEGHQSLSIDISTLPRGIYYVSFSNGKKNIKTQKLLVE